MTSSYIAQDSALRLVHGEQVVAFSGGRALLLMAAHPVAFEGFFASTASLGEPYERLQRAGDVLHEITWGDRRRADVMTSHARAAHAKATGSLPEAAGRFPAGTTYRADDPELLLWILACMVDSCLLVYERFVRGLTPAEKESYWQGYRVIGEKFGIPDDAMPATYAGFRLYWRETLAGPDLAVTPRARELGRKIVFNPPVPTQYRPLVELANFVTVGLLPGDIRRGYGLGWDPVRALWLRGAAEYAKRVVLPLAPSRVRLTPSARELAASL